MAKPYIWITMYSPNEVSDCFIEVLVLSIPNYIGFQKYADYLIDTHGVHTVKRLNFHQ